MSAKFVSRVLTVKQKQQRLSIKLELRDCASSLSSILGNETWISGYDPVTRVQSCQRKSPRSPGVKKGTSIKFQY